MNRRQWRALYFGLGALAFVTLMPPWNAMAWDAGHERLSHRLGHAPLFAPPEEYSSIFSIFQARIAWDQLTLYWVAIVVLTSLAIALLRSGRSVPAEHGPSRESTGSSNKVSGEERGDGPERRRQTPHS